MRARWGSWLGVAALLLCLGAGGTAAAATVEVPAAYLSQQLAWAPCPEAPGTSLRCALMTVPLDWGSPGDGRELKVAVSRLPAADPGHRRGVLLTNPGGPGVPGLYYPLLWHFLKAEVAAVYDVIGLDPRGSGLSTPRRCDGLGADLPADIRDRSPANRAALEAYARAYLQRCVEGAGDLVRSMNTFQTVRDMDLLRRLLGEERISYMGASAGTWLGAWYASTFPTAVDRFVLDGNVDFTSTWYEWQRIRPAAFQRKWETDYLPWLARYDEVYGYGATPEAARATWEARRAALARQPLAVTNTCTIRATDFDQTTWLVVFVPEAAGGLPAFAQALSLIERMDVATAAERRFVEQHFICAGPRSAPGVNTDDLLAATGTICGDTPSPGFDRYAADADELGRQFPLLGSFAEVITGYCGFWPFGSVAAPVIDGSGLPPILMVNNDRDPATPIEGAMRAASRFSAARLLVVRNESMHTIYGLGNVCADRAVDAYLLTGALPPPGATCEGSPLPPPPEAEEAPAPAPARALAEAASRPALRWLGRYAEAAATAPCAGATTLAMRTCFVRRAEAVDRRIAAALARIRAGASAPAARRLAASQRAWRSYRAVECRSRADLHEGGTLAVVDAASCRLELARARFRALQARLRNP